MSVYLDASVLVALITDDPLTPRAEALLTVSLPILIVSDFAAAEFASAVARRVRTREMTVQQARDAFSTFDDWTARATRRVPTSTAAVGAAEGFLRRLGLTLRTPDALNIAIALEFEAELLTFDEKMRACAKALGLGVMAA